MASITGPGSPAQTEDPIAVARGWLALALEQCDTPSAGALALCAAWDELDQTASVGLTTPDRAPRRRVTTFVDHARSTLRASTTSIPATSLLPVARALDHLDDAAELLRLESSCDGEPWR